jgi:hypothetical protein
VSISSSDLSAYSTFTSTASRVVPAISDTITRFCPAIVFTSVDLPALRLPTMAIFRSASGSGVSSGSGSSS